MNHQIANNLKTILKRIQDVSVKRTEDLKYFTPRLVAVSKTKPISDIIEAYNEGHRHFGENYVQELVEKAHSDELKQHCPDIRWHFIGNFQKNKVNKMLSVPNLYVIETIDSVELADLVNRSWTRMKTQAKSPSRKGKEAEEAQVSSASDLLNIMIQVNTSGEEQKGGIKTSDVCSVYDHIVNNCKYLKIMGLMTIGSLDASLNSEKNADFEALIECRKRICEQFSVNYKSIELSMGMSHDFEQAVLMGSTNIRVGSSIFGSRS